MKLIKHKCVVLFKHYGTINSGIIGVFKNKKQADKYLAWLEKNKTSYSIRYAYHYEYVKEVEKV